MEDVDWKTEYEKLMAGSLQMGFDLRQEIAALRDDARRYRWLKENAQDAGMWDDASIDAAMEE